MNISTTQQKLWLIKMNDLNNVKKLHSREPAAGMGTPLRYVYIALL